MLGKHLIKSWSSTQASVALSSGEAEFYGVVKASGVALGYQALLEDLGLKLPVRAWTDSSATIGICARQGLGKLRHVDTQSLWVQQAVRSQLIELRKVRGEANPADLFTKHLQSNERIRTLLQLFGCDYATGRAEAAPHLRTGSGTSKGELLTAAEDYPDEDLMDWDNKIFIKTVYDGPELPAGTWVPEAYEHNEDVLPHEHLNLEATFPRAVAVPTLGDKDPPQHDGLEDRGVELGRTTGGRQKSHDHTTATCNATTTQHNRPSMLSRDILHACV